MLNFVKVENSGESMYLTFRIAHKYTLFDIIGEFLFLRKENRNGNVPVFLCPETVESSLS